MRLALSGARFFERPPVPPPRRVGEPSTNTNATPLDYLAVAVCLVGSIVVELLFWPGRNQPVMFTIPLLVASWRLPPRVVAATVVVLVAADLLDASLARTSADFWPFTLGALIVTGVLAVWLARERRRTRTLAREAAAARARLQEFLGMVSHDLGSPTFAVVGMADLLGQSPTLRLGEEDRRALAVIASAARRMQRLTADLRDAAAIGRDHFTVRLAPSDLVALARQVVERRQALTERHAIRLRGPDALVGAWDAERLDQLLDNLLANAVAYSRGGEIGVTISRSGPDALLAVSDDGNGIPPERLGLIFEPFIRLDPRSSPRGMGLGLYIARGIAAAHRGRIWAESSPGHGTTVSVALPIEPAAADRDEVTAHAGEPGPDRRR